MPLLVESMPARSFTAQKLGRRMRPRGDREGARVRPREGQPDGERRDRDLSQDTAVYTCQCGMVFQALVNTSVDCPHCGGPQAW
jgi:hypothetical protein